MAGRGRKPNGRPKAGTPAPYRVVVAPGVCRTLAVVAGILLVCHAVLSFLHYRVAELPWLLLQLFDVDQENNLPTWYSAFLLAVTAAFLWLEVQATRSAGGPWIGAWRVLAIGFLLMSVDEVAGVHESINSIIVPSWAIPGGIAAALGGLAFVPFLLQLPRRTAGLFALSGAIFLVGAAGLEIVGNDMVARSLRDTLRYSMTTLVEESLEMGGVLLFLHALLSYMGDGRGGPVHAEFRVEGEIRVERNA